MYIQWTAHCTLVIAQRGVAKSADQRLSHEIITILSISYLETQNT